MKTFNIVALVIFSLSLLCEIGFVNTDPGAAVGWGFIATIFGLALSIVVLNNKGTN